MGWRKRGGWRGRKREEGGGREGRREGGKEGGVREGEGEGGKERCWDGREGGGRSDGEEK